MLGKTFVWATGVMLMMTQMALAQPEAPAKAPSIMEQFAESKVNPPLLQGENAATAYIAAWDSISADTRVIVGNSADERQHSTLVEQQAYVERLIAAAMLDKCDWGLNYAGGLDTLLPHLGMMRASARVLAADATRLMSLEGTTEQRAAHEREAMRRIKAILGLSRHVRDDRVLISSLVSAAITSLGRSWVEERVYAGTLSVESAQVALGAMRQMRREDLFGIRASVEGEGDIFDNWLKAEFSDEAGPEKLAELIGTMQAEVSNPADAVIAKMTRAEFDKAVAQMREFYTDNAAVWTKPDGREQIGKLATAVLAGDYGPITMRLAAVLDRAWTADDTARREFGATEKLLEAYIAHAGKLPAEMQKQPEGQ